MCATPSPPLHTAKESPDRLRCEPRRRGVERPAASRTPPPPRALAPVVEGRTGHEATRFRARSRAPEASEIDVTTDGRPTMTMDHPEPLEALAAARVLPNPGLTRCRRALCTREPWKNHGLRPGVRQGAVVLVSTCLPPGPGREPRRKRPLVLPAKAAPG